MEDPKKEMVLATLLNEIRTEGPLMAELARRRALTSLHQFMSKVEEFINQEENINALPRKRSSRKIKDQTKMLSKNCKSKDKSLKEKSHFH